MVLVGERRINMELLVFSRSNFLPVSSLDLVRMFLRRVNYWGKVRQLTNEQSVFFLDIWYFLML